MPHDPIEAATALSRLNVAEQQFQEAQEVRRQAILHSVRAGVPLREVALAAHCSHETIRRIVAADGAVTVEFGDEAYPLPGQSVDVLLYKLVGHARGSFAADLPLHGAGTAWLEAAGALADELQAAKGDADGTSVRVDDARGFALHQVLRFTQKTQPSILASLAESLSAKYGSPPYPPTLLRRWSLTAVSRT